MNISFRTVVQIIAEILSSKINKIPLSVAVEEIAKKYNMSEEDVTYICNERKILY
jgi:hypothetical protein